MRKQNQKIGRILAARGRILCLAAGSAFALGTAAEPPTAAGLAYDAQTRSVVPIPPSEHSLQSTVAAPWFKVSTGRMILEGAIFDRSGNLLFCDVSGGRVMRLTPDKQLSTIVRLDGLFPGGLAIHKDGRLFIAALTGSFDSGAVLAVNLDGTGLETIIPVVAGYAPNDLVFGDAGGFYFTDFKGTSTAPKGGVYYASPDFQKIEPILPNLAQANGVALSPDGKSLWATEFGRNLLHRVHLADATSIAPIGSAIAYHFVGPAPDSMRVDADGNVYVALYGQGRVMVFNPNGIPIGQVLLPGRDSGHNLASTSLAIDPHRNSLYAVSNDGEGGQGAMVFHATVFSKGLRP